MAGSDLFVRGGRRRRRGGGGAGGVNARLLREPGLVAGAWAGAWAAVAGGGTERAGAVVVGAREAREAGVSGLAPGEDFEALAGEGECTVS